MEELKDEFAQIEAFSNTGQIKRKYQVQKLHGNQ